MKVERVFSILAENTVGMSAYYWIEQRDDGYHLMNVELGHCGGPFPTAVDALTCDGTEYGGDYIELTCTLPLFEFAQIIQHIDHSDSRMRVNDTEVEADFVSLINAYAAQVAPKLSEVDALMQQMSLQKNLPFEVNPERTPLRDDPNRPETEEDGFRDGQLRQLQVIHNHKVNRLRDIDPNLPPEERERLTAEINDEAEQRRAMVLKKQP